MEKFLHLLEFVDNQTLIVFGLIAIAICLIFTGASNPTVDNISSGLLGMAMATVRSVMK